MGTKAWADLHHHSEYSLLDGYGKLEHHVARAVELGHPAVAFTEHGTMRGFVALDSAAKAHKIKPIFGCEFYVTRNHAIKGLSPEQELCARGALPKGEGNKAVKALELALGVHEARHCVVIALDEAGYRNLLLLNQIANKDGFLRTRAGGKPRIDLDVLISHNEGLAVSTACLGGILAQSWFAGDHDRVVDDAVRLANAFGDRFSIEIQPHPLPEQVKWNKYAVSLANALEIPVIVTNDSHYIVEKDWKTHDALITMRFGGSLDDPDRIRYHPKSFAMKDEDQILDAFDRNHPEIPAKVIDAGIDRAAEIADRARAEMWRPSRLLLPIVTDDDPDEVLRDLCLDGWEWRDIPARSRRLGISGKVYTLRLAHELRVMRNLKFSPYFLVVHDMIKWAREQGIMTGPGRGSAAGSLVCYLLGITAIDPLEHGLLFERFLTPGRKDWPDIDCDIERGRRSEVMAYLVEKYGDDKVAQIGTIGRMRGRMALRDVARIHRISSSVIDKVATTIVSSVIRDGGETSIREALEESPAMAKFARENKEVVNTTLILEGHIRQIGIHAAGVLVSPIPLAEVLPLEARISRGEVVIATGYDMHDVENVGGIKIDLLGLTTLSVIADAVRLVKERTGEALDMETIDLNDKETLDLFTEGDFIGVFQFDSPTARAACAGVEFDSFEDIASMNAINRPGVSRAGLDEVWKQRKADPSTIVSLHPVIDRACADSLGVMIYQEHIIKILQELAGFSPEEAGRLRKAISKSKGVGYLETEREPFVEGAMSSGMRESDADRLWTQIEQFGAYGFNKCLTADTTLQRADGTTITIGEAEDLTHAKTSLGEKFRAGRWRILQMDDDGRVRPGFVKAVHCNGIKPVFRVVTESGRAVTATGNHRFLTDKGYRTVAELATGDLLVCLGSSEGYEKKGRQSRGKGASYEGNGFRAGEKNPSWIDGRRGMFRRAKDAVFKRSNGVCESCGAEQDGRHEFAHANSLEASGGDYSLYHSSENLRFLCNSCHKRFDYSKGERRPAWSKGKPTELDAIASVEPAGMRAVFDVEMATPEHNFVADGIVSHNSHAAAYGAIAYWCQWLKVRHPIEFFAALLANESDSNKANRIVREAARRGVSVEPPDLNASKEQWTVRRGSLVAGLGGIKGVGENACKELLAGQPFKDLPDFFDRVNRRVVNRTVVLGLAKSGALRTFCTNSGWLVENIERIMKTVGKRKGWIEVVEGWLGEGEEAPRLSSEDEWALRLEVGVAGSGEHPLGILKPMDDRLLRTDWGDLGKPKDGDLVRGVVTARKVGTSDGRKWASLELEDEHGNATRVRFDGDAYTTWRELIDLGPGALLAVRLNIGPRGGMKVDWMADLLALRREWVSRGRIGHSPPAELNEWPEWQGCLVRGDHPAYGASKGIAGAMGWHKRRKLVNVLVTAVKTVWDKNRNKMAFVRVEGVAGRSREVVLFSSAWEELSRPIEAGDIIGLKVKKDAKSDSLIADTVIIRDTST